MKVNLKDLIQNKLNVYLIVLYVNILSHIQNKNSINIVFYFFDIIIIKLM